MAQHRKSSSSGIRVPRPVPAGRAKTGQAASRRARRKMTPLDLLLDLLPIPGPSGQEAAIQARVRDYLIEAGVPSAWIQVDEAHRRSPHPQGVGNLIVQFPGTERAPRRMLVSHLDTVPLCAGCQPRRKGHFLRSADPTTGLGADNRAGVAVVLSTALRLLREEVPHPPLTLLWTVQEEIGLQGARLVQRSRLGRPRMAFNWDGGSSSKVTIGATGGYRMQIEVQGKASHAGNAPEKGISAIAIAALAIAQLQQQGWHGAVQQRGRKGTSNVGVIQGGAATNVVTDHLLVRAEARSHDPQFRQLIVTHIEEAFREAVTKVRNTQGEVGRVKFRGQLDYESFALPTGHPVVQEAIEAVRATGREPELAISNGGLDANWLTAYGIPTVTFGCGQMFPHTLEEALDVREFEAACEVAWNLARGQAL